MSSIRRPNVAYDRRRPAIGAGRLWFLFAILLAISPVASAETTPLTIVSATPASGTAGVPTQTIITFEFNKELSPNTSDWNTAVVEPRQAVTITSAQLCVNPDPCGGQGIPRYVRYVVQHAPNTDFTWLFFAAKGINGQLLETPYVLRYSTAPDIGSHTTSGQVIEQHAFGDIPPSVRSRLAPLIERARAAELGPAVAELADGGYGEDPRTAAQAIDLPNTRVYLLSSFAVEQPAWNVKAASVLAPSSSNFSITHLRDGTYWPLVVRFTDTASMEIDAVGYLPDASGEPAPLQIAGGSITAVELSLWPFPLRTATAALDEAESLALGMASDAELIQISGDYGLRPAGTAYTWTYTYRSGVLDKLIDIEIHPLSATTATSAIGGHFGVMDSIPGVPLDSDAIMALVMDRGGEEFLAGYPLRNIRTTMIAGHRFWVRPEPEPFWHVILRTVTTSTTRTKEWFIDMASGEPVSAESELAAGRWLLAPIYPNPARDRATIPLTVIEHGRVVVEVYDLSGRRIATIADEPMPAGLHLLEWEIGGAAAGTYLIRASAGNATWSTRATVVR